MNHNNVICETGVIVSALSRAMIKEGYEGFEGLIDLPGTIGAAIYGNAGCYGCSVNNLLQSFDILCPNGNIISLEPQDLNPSKRSTSLKEGVIKGVIIRATLNLRIGNKEKLLADAIRNTESRKRSIPNMKNNLGSVFAGVGRRTCLYFLCMSVVKLYGKILKGKYSYLEIQQKELSLLLTLLFARDLIPYLYHINCFVWKDDVSHKLFWKYVNLYRCLFRGDKLEIEIPQY